MRERSLTELGVQPWSDTWSSLVSLSTEYSELLNKCPAGSGRKNGY
jgi:hypothetical protein